MSDLFGTTPPSATGAEDARLAHVVPLPRISLQAFCETPDFASAVQAAAADRRMSKVHV